MNSMKTLPFPARSFRNEPIAERVNFFIEVKKNKGFGLIDKLETVFGL